VVVYPFRDFLPKVHMNPERVVVGGNRPVGLAGFVRLMERREGGLIVSSTADF